jgi:transcriptional regulator
MYQPRVFREDDRSRLHDLIERHAFGMLLVPSPDGSVEASHLPFHLDRNGGPHGCLTVHVARANPIWEGALASGRVTAVFTGPHAYVSPLWYEHPDEQVPTWNYAVVHARGVPRLLTP